MSAAANPLVSIETELARHWPAVLACFVTAIFGWGFGFSGTSVYLAELHRLHGWSAARIGFAITVYYLIGAACLPNVHAALRRLGPRKLLIIATVLLGAGATLFARSQQPWQLFAAASLMALGWAGCTSTAISTVLAMYFDRQRGLAITLALNGASMAGFTVGPVLVAVSQYAGVGRAVPLTAFALLIIVLPLCWFGLKPPSDPVHARTNAQPAAGIDVLKTWHFWSVALPFALALAAQVGLIIQLVSFLLPQIGPSGAATGLAITSVAAMSGRIVLATVIDRLPQRLASAASFTSQAGGVLLMLCLPDHPMALYAGCIIFGLSVGNVITFPALIIQREFPAASFGRLIDLSTSVAQFSFALAPAALGLIRDVTNGYTAVLLVCIGLQLFGALIILTRPRARQSTVINSGRGDSLTVRPER